MCMYYTKQAVKWSINNEAVNMCARPLPTNHSLSQGSRANTNSHMHLWGERGNSGFEGREIMFLCLDNSSPSFCFSIFCPVSPQKHADV